jgi:hypothetical protein
MSDDAWTLRVEDSVDSQPFTLVGDLVVVVRTPRSNDFVTVEVGRVQESRLSPLAATPTGVASASKPVPWVMRGWCGEVYLGRKGAVTFELAGEAYRLTLERIDHTRWHQPFGAYDFRLERHPRPSADHRTA